MLEKNTGGSVHDHPSGLLADVQNQLAEVLGLGHGLLNRKVFKLDELSIGDQRSRLAPDDQHHKGFAWAAFVILKNRKPMDVSESDVAEGFWMHVESLGGSTDPNEILWQVHQIFGIERGIEDLDFHGLVGGRIHGCWRYPRGDQGCHRWRLDDGRLDDGRLDGR